MSKRKSSGETGGNNREDPLNGLEWHPEDPETLSALADMAALDAKMVTRELARQSWFYRHPKATWAGIWVSLLAQPVAGEIALGGHWEGQNHSGDLARAAAYKRCEAVVKKNIKPGSVTSFVRLSTLSEQQQKDCGYEYVSDYVTTAPQQDFIGGALGSEILTPAIDPMVKLPDIEVLQTTEEREVSNSTKTQYLERIYSTLAGIGSAALTINGLTWLIGLKRRKARQEEEAST